MLGLLILHAVSVVTVVCALVPVQAGQGKKEHLYKILVIGDLGTGKTSIIKRYVHQFFSPHYRATVSSHTHFYSRLLCSVYCRVHDNTYCTMSLGYSLC